MSTLTEIDKRYLEKILGMQSGYVLDYSDTTFQEFFTRYGLEIHSQKYQTYGSSKARKMRAFWEKESDAIVGQVLDEMLGVYEVNCLLNGNQPDAVILEQSRKVVARLTGKPLAAKTMSAEEAFLQNEFSIPSLQKLPVEATVVPIIENRLKEAQATMSAKAYLSTIFLCGSVLEAVLLGAAQKEPARFNRSSASPKSPDGKPKLFHDWTLSQLIDVSCEIGLLKPDVQKFSHGLRDFRNYIHPYAQMLSRFSPDKHTATLCFQTLKAALASVAGERA
ncbi:hypothetical protein CFR78_08000 [Komagataeibacter rhaeticus]|uniref:hypothetical protein n=1 Tax=Komagataeibacter rhaeticus TaxID=215221 RepID=UPI000D9D2ABE|nr:hypothetical protein [Komagataeibacter rhaeticus]PYD53572.1 hypothetical protein CFR78_08000 [Komagataeibacter rhaeticus]GBQ10875.1 hypothetical protein AA16663_0649 [Komagataeibacter rhaeticus DSM 16663]